MEYKSFKELTIEMLTGDSELQAAYLKASFEDNSDQLGAIISAISKVAEVQGKEYISEDLSANANPRIDTFFKIIDALGMRLTVEAKDQAAQK